ncbi:MAG: helix-turn-helix domain-containing protein [Lachnospiraceae bacterium]|nr:helix-turn-helix domain-containing protein [Lachnospiraceae bacterium]
MFDMQRIGKKIVSLRKQNNMTQMELADRMGISFQAVSNWERGNSMPDISKLPELAEIFEVSLDELLGEKSSLVEAAVENKLEECMKSGDATEEEIKDVLPILKPDQIQNMAANADAQTICAFLPFLDEDDVEELARKAKENGQQFAIYLPFLDDEVIAEWARDDKKNGKSIAVYLPFMDKDDVVDMAKEALKNGEFIY